MNELEIRQNFHRKRLQRQHVHKHTLVIDELGLNHGKSRADIVVINGLLIGYEIKSNADSLIRLKQQIKSYNSIFDKSHIIVGKRYVDTIHKCLPDWWGIILAVKGSRLAVNFKLIRKPCMNQHVNPVSIARLLWRDEAANILRKKGMPTKLLRRPRAFLYQSLAEKTNISELREIVRESLEQRNNWRRHEPLVQYDDSCQPFST